VVPELPLSPFGASGIEGSCETRLQSFTKYSLITYPQTLTIAFPILRQNPSTYIQPLTTKLNKMAAMFSQNPLMNGPNYSFNQAPSTAAGNKEHGFYP
jgi:hypothetical protein